MKNLVAIVALGVVALNASAAETTGRFSSQEFSVIGYGTYVDKADGRWGGGFGLDYFFTRHFGVGAITHWENADGAFFDNLAGEAYLRLPLGQIPLAPYAVGTVGYSWETQEWFESIGGGLEVRFTEKLGLFGDAQWQFNNGDLSKDGITARAGLRLTF